MVAEAEADVTQASLKVAQRSVRANITNIKNFDTPILGSGPFFRSSFYVRSRGLKSGSRDQVRLRAEQKFCFLEHASREPSARGFELSKYPARAWLVPLGRDRSKPLYYTSVAYRVAHKNEAPALYLTVCMLHMCFLQI